MRPSRIGRPRTFDERVAELNRHIDALHSELVAAEQRIARLESQNRELTLVVKNVPKDMYRMVLMAAIAEPAEPLADREDREADVNSSH
jgi:hypothetical protein